MNCFNLLAVEEHKQEVGQNYSVVCQIMISVAKRENKSSLYQSELHLTALCFCFYPQLLLATACHITVLLEEALQGLSFACVVCVHSW